MTRRQMIMQEHPSWHRAADGHGHRVVRVGTAVWSMCATTSGTLQPLHLTGDDTPVPVVDWFTPTTATVPAELAATLAGLGTVGRVRNPDLWDALGTAIIRQVIRAGQSKLLYRWFCAQHGDSVTTSCGTGHLFPRPEVALDLSEEAYRGLGMAFKRRPLQAAASAYLEHGAKWVELPAVDLLQEIQTVPRIGPWTAGAALADYTNDWTLYPYGDLAVRTWATRAAPALAWPDQEATFAAAWRQAAGGHLSTLTVATLAWGSLHGDIG